MISKASLAKFSKYKNKAPLRTSSLTNQQDYNSDSGPSPIRPSYSESDMQTPICSKDESFMSCDATPAESPASFRGLSTFQMQMEIVNLRNQLNVVKSGDDRTELLDLLQEKDNEIERMRRDLDFLDGRFNDIKPNLEIVEKERHILRKENESLEEKNRVLNKQLSNREREVSKLAQRCSLQEEAKKESYLLSKKNQELMKKIDDNQFKFTALERKYHDIELKLREKIEELGSVKNEKDVCDKVIEENNVSFENLNKEIKQISVLKVSVEEDLARAITEKDNFQNQIETLKDHNSTSQKRIEQLEEINRDTRSTISSLRTEIITLTQDYEAQIENMRAIGKTNSTRHKEDLNAIESELNEKIEAISKLEATVSKYQSDIKCLQEAQEEHVKRIKKFEIDIEKYKEGNASISLRLDESNNKISSLMTRNDELRVNFESLENKHQEALAYKAKFEKSEENYARLRNEFNAKQKECELLMLQIQEKDTLVMKYENKITKAKAQMNEKNEQINSLENDYKNMEKEAAVIALDLEKEIHELQSTVNDLESELKNINEEKAQSAKKIEMHGKEMAKLQDEMNATILLLQNEKKSLENRNEMRMTEQRETISNLIHKLREKEASAEDLEAKMKESQREMRSAEDQRVHDVAVLERKISQLNSTIEHKEVIHRQKVESMQENLSKKDNEISQTQQEIDKIHEVLEERTSLLSDIVSQNKSLSSDLEEARAFVGELQDETEIYLQSKEELQHRYDKLETEYKQQEQLYQKRLREEKLYHAQLTKELENFKELYKAAKQLEKELTESQKENVMLRDKVKRQEAFLKRKLNEGKNVNGTGNNKKVSSSAVRCK